MVKFARIVLHLVFTVILSSSAFAATVFPSGTIFVSPDIVTSTDRSSFVSMMDAGTGLRTMFDRRVGDWVSLDAYLFDVTYSDGITSEVQVNPEFATLEAAREQALTYAWLIGQLPYALRRDVESIWIHMGTEPFGGGNRSILIHTGQSDLYSAAGILEETLIHEAAHTSLDADHASSPEWVQAQTDDVDFISPYARDFPDREDIAESFLMFIAATLRADRLSPAIVSQIENGIPNRLEYFADQNFDLSLYSVVPVPGGFALLASSLGVLALRRRKKRIAA